MNGASWSFVIVAGGAGSRMGGTPKQFRMLAGRPLWRWSFDIADGMRKRGCLTDIVLVLPEEYVDEYSETAKKLGLALAKGGKTRALSVLNGLKNCSGSHVLIHDGARPFVTERLCLALMDKAGECGAAVPLLPSADSLKKIEGGKISCADRSLYYRTQTPQAFAREELAGVLAASDNGATDEAGAWIAAGRPLAYAAGEEQNFKITTNFDWLAACALAEGCTERRVGHGYDIHQLAAGRRMILAGVEMPELPYGLYGHSDADIVTHTVMDALLGAAGEPDIGTLFPASDEKWRGADSIKMLHSVKSLLASKGWRIEWIDATLNAQIPKLAGMIPVFIDNMNKELGAAPGSKVFSMKVKSAEHCGSAGRGECMVCHAAAQISRSAVC